MGNFYGNDFRDLDDPANIINRSPQERRLAFAYFLKAGSIAAFQQRVDYMRQADPGFIVDLSLLDLDNSALWQVNLGHANMRFTQMPWCDLRHAVLVNADMTGINLMGADLRGANLAGAKLERADLRGADLEGANLRDVDLSRALQGDIPPEFEKDNPGARRAVPRLPTRDRNPQLPGNVGMGEALTGGYAAPKREYGLAGPSSQLKDGPSPAEELQKEMADKRKKKKSELDKFHKKKKIQQKFFDKKKKETEGANNRKKKDQEVWERKQKQQEKFIQQKYDDQNKKK